jgi:ribosomal protein L10
VTIDIPDFDGHRITVPTPIVGRAAATDSRPVVLSTEDAAIAAGQATSVKQDAQTAILTSLAGYLDGVEGLLAGASTQTTLAAVLAKLIAAPATEAKQDALNTAIAALQTHVVGLETLGAATNTALGTLATQATLAAVLAKLIAAPATEAKQDALNTLMVTLLGYVDGLETLAGTTNTALATLHADLTAPTPAGTLVIGRVGIDQTAGQNLVSVASPASIAAGQVTVTGTVASLLAARAGRQTVTIENTGTVAFYVGPAGVAAATGMLIPGVVGASVTLNTSAAIFAVTASGSAIVSYLETF